MKHHQPTIKRSYQPIDLTQLKDVGKQANEDDTHNSYFTRLEKEAKREADAIGAVTWDVVILALACAAALIVGIYTVMGVL